MTAALSLLFILILGAEFVFFKLVSILISY